MAARWPRLEAVPELAARGGAWSPRPKSASARRSRGPPAGRALSLSRFPAYPACCWRAGQPAADPDRARRRAAAPSVAIVGARNASAGAVKLARDFGAALAQAGCAVISGLARGIDAAAHRGALAAMADGGGTVGVIASGIDIAYPPENAALQDEVAEGLLIAEMPPGTEPLARHFPHRNRIIAGLATGTLVVEAAPKSGSLITAAGGGGGARGHGHSRLPAR
jgi:DNA processing protein